MSTTPTILFNLPEAAVCIQPENDLGISIWMAIESISGKKLLFTKGMSQFNQTTNSKTVEHVYQFVELYFLLPTYWKIEAENQKWPLVILKRLMNAPQEKEVWFGPGDTFVANKQLKEKGNDATVVDEHESNNNSQAAPINDIFQQNHFILNEAVAAKKFIETWGTEGIHFLSLIPIFQKEFEYKQSRSAYELFDHFSKKNVTELIDEYRKRAVKKRFFGLF